MICKKIPLDPNDESVYLNAYLNPEAKDSDALLVIPGGGYSVVCGSWEGEPIANRFAPLGFVCFELYYSIGEKALYPKPLVDAALAMKHIKDHAEEYGINPDRVFALGFSAGGHLTGMLGTMWHREELHRAIPDMEYGYAKPRGVVLCYAVQSSTVWAHRGSIENLTGGGKTEEELRYYSIDASVDARSVPAFFWHTAEDQTVPVQNTILTAAEYARVGIPFEVHIYPFGQHGISLGDPEVHKGAVHWPEQAALWMKRM